MSDIDPTGTDWISREIDLIIADYFDMLRLELSGVSFVKSERNRALQELIHRSRGSIEFKHQNISAVLVRLGHPFIRGYLPRTNFQNALLDGIERFLEAHPEALSLPSVTSSQPLLNAAERSPIFFEQPPSLVAMDDQAGPARLQRLVRKFDPAERDAKNRLLGRSGEETVLQSERARLHGAGRPDLSKKVKWVSAEEGDGAGFDILSFDIGGAERLLEVKTTVGGQTTPFFLSENERSLSSERPQAFRLVRLYDFRTAPRAFELVPPLTDSVILRPTNYRASFA